MINFCAMQGARILLPEKNFSVFNRDLTETVKTDIYNGRVRIRLSKKEFVTVEIQMCLTGEIFVKCIYKRCCQDPDLLPKFVNTECLDVPTWRYLLKAIEYTMPGSGSFYVNIRQVLYSVKIRIC
jgi:hypothetical protein